MPLQSDELVRQTILLGGQVSHKHKIFQELARMSPDYAEIYEFLKMLPEWEKETDQSKVLLDMLELLGMVDFVRSSTEITRLSMIIGDDRARVNMKKVMDDVRKSGTHTEP